MRCAVSQPADAVDQATVAGGLVTKWLVIGPFAVHDGIADFDKELLSGEANVAPKAGDEAAGLRWKPAEPTSDGVSFMAVRAVAA